ncbi:MAG: NUDIX hydrolase [Alphaproteobacteria bacterium]
MSPPAKTIHIKSHKRQPGQRAARPRDAASLIVLRRTASGLEILMGRRPPKSRFMPDAFVFPGGRVDVGDARVQSATHISAELEAHLTRSCRPARARALAMAAVRETFEETGLLLGAPGSVGGTRNQSWSAIGAGGLAPDLARLDYIARAVTNHDSAIRFDARFFMADAKYFSGTLGGSGELLDLAFVPFEAARGLPSAVITQFVLSEVVRLETAKAGQRTRRADYRWRAGKRVVSYV